MGWNGSGSVVRSDGTRTGTDVWQQADAAGVDIESDDHDTHDEDLADAIEKCWNREGENALAANCSAGGFKITNVGAATAASDALGYDHATPRFTSTDAGASMAPTLTLYRNSASPADADVLGGVKFDGEDSGGSQTTYGQINATADDVTDATEDGHLSLYAMMGGSLTEILQVGGGSVAQATMLSADAGASIAPILVLHRDSASPADDDALGAIKFDGEDDGSAQTTYAQIRGVAEDVTDATEDGRITMSVMAGGTLTDHCSVNGSRFLVGKADADQGATAGVELELSGTCYMTRSAGTCLIINRLSDDGTLVSLQQAGSIEGSITVSGTTVAYNTFTGGHEAEWSPDHAPKERPPLGTLLSSTGEPYERRNKPQLCKVKVTDEQADRAVYGVFGTITEDGDVLAYSLGTAMVRAFGPCAPGDLLRSSATPGVAEVQPDDLIRASTLGKVTGRLTDAGEGLVSAVLYSG